MSLNKSLINSQQNLTDANLENNYTYEFEDFRLDARSLMLYRNSQTVSLKPKVIETLVALVERSGEVVSKDELMQRLWADSFVEESNLTQNIYLLRKTLGNCGDGRPFIETFSRRGYRFNGPLKAPVGAELLIATHTRTQTVTEETFENRTRRKWLIPAVAIIALGAAVIFAVKQFIPRQNAGNKNPAAASFQNFKIKRQSETGDVTVAKVSADGKFIAYGDKKNSIWLKNVATNSNIQILPGSESIGLGVAAISPDNNYLYMSRRVDDKRNEVIRMPLFGGGVQQKIIDDHGSDLSLSPDGKQLTFVRSKPENGQIALMVANVDGSGERQVAAAKENDWFGMWSQATAWSPDGSQIACTGGTTEDGKALWKIKIFRAADGEEISEIKPEAGSSWIDAVLWLPDGDDLLVITGDNASQGQIYKYTISTAVWQRVTNDLSDYVNLSVTLDGSTVITTQQANPGNLWLLPANGDTGRAKQITFGRNLLTDATGVSWTTDGKIVYSTNTGGKWEIRRIDADGANQTQLTQNCAGNDSCGQPMVTPDGKYIIFQAWLGGISNIWRMDVDGANARPLTSGGGFGPRVTPDGTRVIYSRFVSKVLMLWQVPVDGGEEQLFSKIPTAGRATISNDGKQMAFSYWDNIDKEQTCIADLDTDALVKCFGISRWFPRWAADGKSIYYLDHNYTGVWKQALTGERELFLSFPGEHTNNFAFSPDGKSLVVGRSKPTQDIVAITTEN